MVLLPSVLILASMGMAVGLASSVRSNGDGSKLLVVGLGRVGRECAKHAEESGCFDEIFGTVRSASTSRKGKLTPIEFGPENVKKCVERCTHILITVQQPEEYDPALAEVYDIINEMAPPDAWVGLISTTGVYGNHDGEWVSEASHLNCKENTSASRYRDYEEDWKRRCGSAPGGRSLRIFRCAGIYGGGQSALHTVHKKGFESVDLASITKDDLTNRVHVADIAAAVCASMSERSHGSSWRIYNIADDLPESRAVVLQYAYDLLRSIGCEITRREAPTPKAGSIRERRRIAEKKLVSNERLRNELLPNGLTYPTYREGLTAILHDADTPWQQEIAIKPAKL